MNWLLQVDRSCVGLSPYCYDCGEEGNTTALKTTAWEARELGVGWQTDLEGELFDRSPGSANQTVLQSEAGAKA